MGRRTYIDWTRGLAVLLMIEAHTTDSWTRTASKATWVFADASLLAGFAAPLFLWLAGLGVALSASRITLREGNRRPAVESVCRRGLEIFILAFLFRLQAFALSPGSYPVTLFRVDILNIMGPGIVVAGLIWGLSQSAAALTFVYALTATTVAMVTPMVRASAAVDVLPIWLQWYVRPAGDNTTFTAFPWVGFLFAGAACGVLIARAERGRELRVVSLACGLGGIALVGLGFYTSTLPSPFRQSSFWTTSPSWFAIRAGILMLVFATCCAVARLGEPYGIVCAPLTRLGRNSLFIYWIHMELVYGYLAWPLRGRLPLWGTATAFVAFSLLMYLAVVLRDKVVFAWRTRRPAPIGAEPTPA